MSGAHEVLAELADRAAAREARKQRKSGPAQRRAAADAQPLSQRLAALAEIAELRDYSPNEGLARWVGTYHPGNGESPYEIEGSLVVGDLRKLQALAEQDEAARRQHAAELAEADKRWQP